MTEHDYQLAEARREYEIVAWQKTFHRRPEEKLQTAEGELQHLRRCLYHLGQADPAADPGFRSAVHREAAAACLRLAGLLADEAARLCIAGREAAPPETAGELWALAGRAALVRAAVLSPGE
jgi:hypothetical protein